MLTVHIIDDLSVEAPNKEAAKAIKKYAKALLEMKDVEIKMYSIPKIKGDLYERPAR